MLSELLPPGHISPGYPSTNDDEQMGSTIFGDAVAADTAAPAAPRQTKTDRGIDGRVSRYV
jgi:hypothetical protein